MKDNSERQLLQKLKSGNEEALKKLYNAYAKQCRDWARKHFAQIDELFEDAYQDSVIILYEAALDGKLDQIQCTLKTYLFAICRNQLLKNFKLQKKQDDAVDQVKIYLREWMEPEPSLDKEIELIRNTIKETEEPCKSILTLFYYQNKANEEIAEILGYPNKNVLKVQKSRCLGYLKEKVINIWKKI